MATYPGILTAPPRCPTAAPRPRARGGFTLIEVLATILLLSIVIPVAMQAVSASTGAASAARHKTVAAGLAESKLAELIATGDWQTGAVSGTFGEEHPEFRWDARAVNWTEASVTQLDVVVTWTSSRRGEESIVLSTLVYLSGTTQEGTGSTGASGSTGGTGTGAGGTP